MRIKSLINTTWVTHFLIQNTKGPGRPEALLASNNLRNLFRKFREKADSRETLVPRILTIGEKRNKKGGRITGGRNSARTRSRYREENQFPREN